MSAPGIFYVVQFVSGSLALNAQSTPALFLTRKAVTAFKTELAEHGLSKSKVRRVAVRIHFCTAK